MDWEAVHADFRLGKFTTRQLAAKHGTNHETIVRKAKREGWKQDLTEAVRQATNARVIEQTVANEVTKQITREVTKSHQTVTNAVDAAAEVNTRVIMQHRDDLVALRNVSAEMLNELSLTTTKQGEIEELFEKVTAELTGPALLAVTQQFRDFMRLHSRVGSIQKLSDTFSKVQTLERRAHGLDEGSGGDNKGDYESMMADIAAGK